MAQPQASSSKLPAQKQVVTLNNDLLGRLKPSKVFVDAVDLSSVPQADRQHTTGPQITSIDFDDTGERCLTTGEDDQIVLWDMRKGRKHKNFWSKKYGCGLGRFTHRAGNILHSSTKSTGSQVDDHAVRYHATHDNKYLAYFKGHTASVRSLQVSPIDDTFLSAGDDGTVRMWDLRLPECKGILHDMGGSVVACYDNTGMVFAVGCSATQTVSLYACQQADSPPFATSELYDPGLLEISVPPPSITITSLSISNNGLYLLVGTAFDFHYLLDAFDLRPVRRLTGHRPLHDRSGAEVSFTADSRYVVSGSADGAVYFWDMGTEKMEPVQTGEDGRATHPAPTLSPTVVVQSSGNTGIEHGAGSRAVRFGPRLCVLAVGGQEVSFWLPAKDEADKMEEGW